jgi:hypothetical protein
MKIFKMFSYFLGLTLRFTWRRGLLNIGKYRGLSVTLRLLKRPGPCDQVKPPGWAFLYIFIVIIAMLHFHYIDTIWNSLAQENKLSRVNKCNYMCFHFSLAARISDNNLLNLLPYAFLPPPFLSDTCTMTKS